MNIKPQTISVRVLLGIYAIVPLCLGVLWADALFFGSALRNWLPTSPQYFFFFQILFGTPHIIASNIILASNKDYFKRYQWRVLGMTLLIIAFFAVGNQVLSYNILFAVVATATIMHVVKQQLGLGNMVARLSGPAYTTWAWSNILLGVVLYNCIFLKHSFSPELLGALHNVLLALGGLILVLTLFLVGRIKKPMGRYLMFANVMMVLGSYYAYSVGYSFLAILGPRVIHDVTAFVVYCVHDKNRHGEQAQNMLYRFYKKLKLSPYIVVPVSAILLTVVLQKFGDKYFDIFALQVFGTQVPQAISLGFIGYLGLMHYYTEAFTWKGDSPYKKHIGFSP